MKHDDPVQTNSPLADRHRCNRRARRGEFWTNTDMGGGPLDPFRLVADADELETVRVLGVPGFFGHGYFWRPKKELVLHTIQFATRPADGLSWPAHLSLNHDDRTLCGVDLFSPHASWSKGGGVCGTGISITPCSKCIAVAKKRFSGFRIAGGEPWRRPLVEALCVTQRKEENSRT